MSYATPKEYTDGPCPQCGSYRDECDCCREHEAVTLQRASLRLAGAAEARLAGVLGARVLAEYQTAGRSTSVPGLLQTALAGLRLPGSAQALPVVPNALQGP